MIPDPKPRLLWFDQVTWQLGVLSQKVDDCPTCQCEVNKGCTACDPLRLHLAALRAVCDLIYKRVLH